MTLAFILTLIAALGAFAVLFFAINYIRKLERELTWTRKQWYDAVSKGEGND